MAGIGYRDDFTAMGIKDMYKVKFEEDRRKPMETITSKIYDMRNDIKGSGDKETDALGIGDFQKHSAENQQIVYNAPEAGYEKLVNFTMYSDGIAMTYENVQDNVKFKDIMNRYVKSWRVELIREEEELGAELFNSGGDLLGMDALNGTHPGNTDSSGKLCYDSSPVFNLTGNTREAKSGDTFFNSLTSTTITHTNFTSAYNHLVSTNNRDERNKVFDNRPDTVLTQTGTYSMAAWQLLNTIGERQSEPGSSTQEANAYQNKGNSWSGQINHIEWAYLDDTSNPWYLMKAKIETRQFITRQEPSFDFYQVPDTKGYRMDCTKRSGIWLKDWRDMLRVGGTAA